jgi:hypothetical protein
MERSDRTSLHENRQAKCQLYCRLRPVGLGARGKTIPPESIRSRLLPCRPPRCPSGHPTFPAAGIATQATPRFSHLERRNHLAASCRRPVASCRKIVIERPTSSQGRVGSLQKHPFSPARTNGRIHYSPCQTTHATRIRLLLPQIPTGLKKNSKNRLPGVFHVLLVLTDFLLVKPLRHEVPCRDIGHRRRHADRAASVRSRTPRRELLPVN